MLVFFFLYFKQNVPVNKISFNPLIYGMGQNSDKFRPHCGPQRLLRLPFASVRQWQRIDKFIELSGLSSKTGDYLGNSTRQETEHIDRVIWVIELHGLELSGVYCASLYKAIHNHTCSATSISLQFLPFLIDARDRLYPLIFRHSETTIPRQTVRQRFL